MLALTRILHKTWSPASATTTETTALFNVSIGDRVLWASAMPQIAASVGAVGTVVLGDGTATNGFMAAFTPTQAANAIGTYINGGGSFLANSGGRLYTVADTVDVVFTYTSGGLIIPQIKFTIAIARESN